ncbi:MAG: nicotinate phosphoribosyltransferase [Sulfurimonas sp.]|nr:MAG: nicotinate phosphoribosyltransferase [Sulfurimonas sp.]
MKYYPYENFKNDTNTLIEKVKAYDAQVIIAIARGGLTLAHAMAEGLEIRNIQTLRTELYDGSTKRNSISIFGTSNLKNIQRVLVVDDIADTGDTLDAVMNKLSTLNPEVEFKVATLFFKKTSIYKPHFWINEATEWVDFFWERDYKQS